MMACSIQIWRFDLASRSASACCLAWSVNESAMPSLLLGGVRTSRNMILAEILDALLVSRSELTIAINNAFKEAGVQIPFPSRTCIFIGLTVPCPEPAALHSGRDRINSRATRIRPSLQSRAVWRKSDMLIFSIGGRANGAQPGENLL